MFKARSIAKNKTKRREAISSDDDGGVIAKETLLPATSEVKRKRGIVDSLAGLEKPQLPEKDPISGSGREPVILAADDALRMTETASFARTVSHSGSEHIGASLTGVGPTRPTRTLRPTSSRFDYQMDICKDFKETGYCGFGDSCKFLHDRSDYKTGWELERDWDQEKAKNDEPEKAAADDKSICSACRRVWSACESPSCVTTCGHYFCERCFLSTSVVNCAVCGIGTNGIFNSI